MLTNKRLRNFNGDRMKRLIDVTKIKAVTKNIYKGQLVDMAIHVKDEYDYRFACNQREEIIQHLKQLLDHIVKNERTGKQGLPIYAVEGGLENYMTTQTDRADGTAKGLPPD